MNDLEIKQLIKTTVQENVRDTVEATQEEQAEKLAELLLKKINVANIQKAETIENQYVSETDEDWRIVRDYVKAQIEREKRLAEQMSNNKINYFFKGVFVVLGVVFGAIGVAFVSLIEKIGN